MHASFSRTITLLRKERGLSQKEVAVSLKISQALLSHYEKGIRECGLDFVVRIADYYNVSCDYLLGRTPDKSGAMIAINDIPESTAQNEGGRSSGRMLPVLNKKLVLNSITVLFELLQRCNHDDLTTEVSSYLNVAIYTVLRSLYAADSRTPAAVFAVPNALYQTAASAALPLTAARIAQLAPTALSGAKIPSLLPDELAKAYPLLASSLTNVMAGAEARLETVTQCYHQTTKA
ncbi:MAG: helix-turn-helix transcriptional regulator [Clostridia bacterium]|nr:helix-turn-helix transcriptional regulator [Clostridia bacterium]